MNLNPALSYGKMVYRELYLRSERGDITGENLSAANHRIGEGDFLYDKNLFCVCSCSCLN